ncbi:coiled-coil domain-containing protein 40 isoform X1 [Tachysurus ichikawai]
MKNIKNKAQAEKRQAEEQKLQQDLYVEHLMKQVEKLRKQIALYEVQTLAQTKDKEAARDALAEQEQEQEVKERNQLLLTKEAAVAKLISTIERNQATISMYNKKIEQIRASTGHEDLGPLEIAVRALNKQLEELGAEKEKHQSWLWQQGELVRLRQEKQAQSSATQTLNTQLTILQQRNIRNKSEIEQEERGLVELERESKVLRLEMEKLNSLLKEKTQLKQELEQSNSLMEKSFIHTLKGVCRDTAASREAPGGKKLLMNSLEEAERQIMLWERKIQLAKETRLAVESEVGKGVMHSIKAEIHCKERHYNQLLKQREMMLREMEAAVTRRENIHNTRQPSEHTAEPSTQHLSDTQASRGV